MKSTDAAQAAQTLIVEPRGAVLVLRLNRPDALNALTNDLIAKVLSALERGDKDDSVRVHLLTGSDKVFAAGADIKELATETGASLSATDPLAQWDRFHRVQKPIVGAVSGLALGGGLELAMNCDMLVAADDAEFGQPEIRIGVMPGAGGTQRLTRALGKYRAMEYILTGKRFTARQAHAWGLVNRLAPRALVFEEALRLAEEVAANAPAAARLAKQAVHFALDEDIASGLAHERRLFYSLFDTEDQKEGMRAFVEKRKPAFKGR
ncbi:MAG: enoyl-CoA hydratase/isomerase family protein [Elusimicrobia bacterium]|nr:enoyl-CoA hydratase/isomerase family protein [Elusimicrobiota bacterium]